MLCLYLYFWCFHQRNKFCIRVHFPRQFFLESPVSIFHSKYSWQTILTFLSLYNAHASRLFPWLTRLRLIDLVQVCSRILALGRVRYDFLDKSKTDTRFLSQIHYSGWAWLIERSWEDGLYKCYAAFSVGRPQRSGFVSQQFSNWIDRRSLPSPPGVHHKTPSLKNSTGGLSWQWGLYSSCILWKPLLNQIIGVHCRSYVSTGQSNLWLIDTAGWLPEEICRKVLLGVCSIDLLFFTVIIVISLTLWFIV